MSKYNRHPSIINRVDSDSSSNDWENEFAKNLEKKSVEARKELSLLDQISAILDNKKPKFDTVEAAVRDMQERSGVIAYREKIKTAQVSSTNEPVVFSKVPNIKNTIKNYIRSTNGGMSIPAILEKIKEIHRKDVPDPKDWEDENLLRFIGTLNSEEQQKHPTNKSEYLNLGKQVSDQSDHDLSNDDAFLSLTPASK